MSRIVRCDPVKPDPAILKETEDLLTRGEAVVIPTETQYALSVRADIKGALEMICRIKQRDRHLSPALFVKDMTMAKTFCEVNHTAERLAERFLPGPMTLVVPSKKDQHAVAEEFLSERGFGLRISSSPFISAIMNRLSFPITATSANVSGRTSRSSIEEIEADLGNAVALYVDAGPCRGIVPSTVVAVSDTMEILRHGAIPAIEIHAVLKEGRGHGAL